MYRHLTRIYWDDEALSQIPPTIQVASKQGAVSQSKSEVVLVNAPHGDYVFCIITKNQEDTRWENDNEGYVLIRKISRLLWNSFEPDHPWTPGLN
jgi:beta-lactamase class A